MNWEVIWSIMLSIKNNLTRREKYALTIGPNNGWKMCGAGLTRFSKYTVLVNPSNVINYSWYRLNNNWHTFSYVKGFYCECQQNMKREFRCIAYPVFSEFRSSFRRLSNIQRAHNVICVISWRTPPNLGNSSKEWLYQIRSCSREGNS